MKPALPVRETIVSLFQKGLSHTRIAHQVGRSISAVTYHVPEGARRQRVIDRMEGKHCRMYAMRAKGYSYVYIGAQFGISAENARVHVSYYAKKRGLRLPNPKKHGVKNK